MNTVLNVTKSGMMAYIDIPKIKCHLPLYHGSDEGTLQSNAEHVDTSSLPVGGKNTHCVISGHTGLPSAKLFTNLETLTEGDTFMLTTLGEILTYEVDQVLIVLPWEVDSLKNHSGRGLLHARDLHAVRGEFTPAFGARTSDPHDTDH